jgi:hypothetical protein
MTRIKIEGHLATNISRIRYNLQNVNGFYTVGNTSNTAITTSTNLSLWATSGVYGAAFYVASDDRYKHNECQIADATSIINKLKPRVYEKTEKLYTDWSTRPESDTNFMIEAGLIAQDVKQIPELEFTVRGGNTVTEKEEDDEGEETGADVTVDQPYSLDYQSINVFAIKAIQELCARVSQLESELQQLKG